PDSTRNEVVVYFRVVNHLAQQKNSLIRIFLEGFVRDLNGVFYSIAKSKMPGDVKPHQTKIKQCGLKIFFPWVDYFSGLFEFANDLRAVLFRNIKLFHKISSL